MNKVQNTPKITAKEQALSDMRAENINTQVLIQESQLIEFLELGVQY